MVVIQELFFTRFCSAAKRLVAAKEKYAAG
jgi:hypothetical protein